MRRQWIPNYATPNCPFRPQKGCGGIEWKVGAFSLGTRETGALINDVLQMCQFLFIVQCA